MKLGLIGAGNMASALAVGIGVPALVTDVVADKARALAETIGGEALPSAAEVAERADAIVLCHKPGQLGEVAAEVGDRARAVVSILAATPIAALEDAYPGVPVYRFIPNIPAELGAGVLCYARGSRADEGPERELLELLARAGTVIPLAEPLLEPAMAIMSCGPAFFALIVESLAEAGERHGLERADATLMAARTMGGTAAWLDAHELDAADLRARVATPGGVTERGLDRLRAERLPEALGAAVDVVVEATR
jgi:pyrroline-5-carboxylate reductase